jgi:TonB family protein
MRRLIQHPALLRFLLLSLMLHILLLRFLPHPEGDSATRYLGETVVNVELNGPVEANKPAHTPQAKNIRPPFDRITTAISHADHDPEHATVINPLTPPVGHADATEKVPSGTGAAKIRNQLLGQLQTRLSRYLVYPPLARQRGWEGTVLLGLRVETDGHLDRVRIEHSSGYAVLDHSALNSLNRLGHLTEAASWLNGRSIDMQLPVIYRLVEN